jgi:thioredoxin 1
MSELIKEINDADFNAEVIQSSTPVLVDFWAEWCGPCKRLAPILEQVAAKMGNKIKIVKVNVDFNPATAAQFGIRSIPTMILFKNGVEVEKMIGAQDISQLITFLTAHT